MGANIFKLENIKHKEVLQIENLEIKQRKVTSIIGASASGKSTLLTLLNKMITADSGEIFFKEKNIKNIDSINLRREVIMLSQDTVVFEGNIKNNLLIGLSYSEKPMADDAILIKVLKKVSLNKDLDSTCDNLSGGEKQRLALARIMLINPEIYLLDEPLSALDDRMKDSIIKMLTKHIKENKKTLIIVTHSKEIIKRYSDFIIELDKGKIIRTEEVKNG